MATDLSLRLGDAGGGRRPRVVRLAKVSGVITLVLLVAYVVLIQATSIRPPRIEDDVRRRGQPAFEQVGPRSTFGANWMSRQRGIWEVHLEGEPYAMGYAHMRLGERVVHVAEDHMFAEMERLVPSRIARFALRSAARLRYRRLDAMLPLDRRVEIAGMADALTDTHSDFLPVYHRLVFYHALHDIMQCFEHSPLLGCSAFAAVKGASRDGKVIVGRNFDFEGPAIFDREKAVLFVKPQGKIPFASISWPGMSGVVTGVSAEGIYISINAARTDDAEREGMPVEIMVREVLENAHSIDEAIQLMKKTPVMVPDLYLIADGKSGEAAVIEQSPARFEVRRTSVGHDTLTLTNHALTAPFSNDAENDRLRRYTTSGARYKRLSELVAHARGLLDPKRALEILRDRKGPGGEPLALHNRNAIDAVIATHSVVVDLTNLTLWVSSGPHLIGKYVGFDLRHELLGEDRPFPLDLPADSLAGSDELRALDDAEAHHKSAIHWRSLGENDRALIEARRSLSFAEDAEPHRLIADILRAGKDLEGARREYQRFLELSPSSLKEIEEVRGILGTM